MRVKLRCYLFFVSPQVRPSNRYRVYVYTCTYQDEVYVYLLPYSFRACVLAKGARGLCLYCINPSGPLRVHRRVCKIIGYRSEFIESRHRICVCVLNLQDRSYFARFRISSCKPKGSSFTIPFASVWKKRICSDTSSNTSFPVQV